VLITEAGESGVMRSRLDDGRFEGREVKGSGWLMCKSAGKSQEVKPGKQSSRDLWKRLEKIETGRQRGGSSGDVGDEAGDCEDERS
jgi:hypothetical protein